jgi:hypothetical protein
VNLPTLAERFKTACDVAEMRWAMLRSDKFEPRLLMRYVRSLRRCQHLRAELSHLMETGKL